MEMVDFWKYYESGQNSNLQKTVFTFTTRSRYTHKRKNKLTKIQKKQLSQLQKPSKSSVPKPENPDVNSSQTLQKQVLISSSPLKQTFQQIYPISLCSFQASPLFKGHLILCSNSSNCKFWRILTHKNTKTIGRKQYAQILLESNQLLFPENYPTTKSYQTYFQNKSQEEFHKYLTIPSTKRPHYTKISSPYAYYRHLELKGCLIVALQIVSKGKCFPYSYICKVEQEDLEGIKEKMNKGRVGIVVSQQDKEGIARKSYKSVDQIKEDLEGCQSVRKIIGIVTGGGYKYSRSREGGVGYITQENTPYVSEFGGYVLIRKSTSRHYMLAQITHSFNDLHTT